MALRDLREFLNEFLPLPVGGRTYQVPPPTAAKGLALQHLSDLMQMSVDGGDITKADQQALVLDDVKEVNFYKDCLGTAYQEMLDDGLTLSEVKVCATTAWLYWTVADGGVAAEAYWNAQAKPDPRLAPTDRLPKRTRAAKASASTGGASTTRRPSSGSTTSSRKAGAPRAQSKG